MNIWQVIDGTNQITARGRLVQSCPLDIERSVLFVSLGELGFQKEAARLLAYIETTNFDKQTEQEIMRTFIWNTENAENAAIVRTMPGSPPYFTTFACRFPNSLEAVTPSPA